MEQQVEHFGAFGLTFALNARNEDLYCRAMADILVRERNSTFHPLTYGYLLSLHGWMFSKYSERLTSRMDCLNGLSMAVIKRLLRKGMAGAIGENVLNAVMLDIRSGVLTPPILMMMVSVLGIKCKAFAEETDKAIENNKNHSNYFLGFEELVYIELFDSQKLESCNGSFLTLEQSIANRVRDLLNGLMDEVGAKSSPVTKYYALITLANVGELFTSLDRKRPWDAVDGDSSETAADDNEGTIAERATPSLFDELVNSNLHHILIIYMAFIYDGFIDDEIEMLIEQEDSPPNSPLSRTFVRKIEKYITSFEDTNWHHLIQELASTITFAFDDGSHVQDFDNVWALIQESMNAQVVHQDTTINIMIRSGVPLDEDYVKERVAIGVSEIFYLLKHRLAKQLTRRSNYDSRRNALILLIEVARLLLQYRAQKPQCAFLWDRDLDTMLTDGMHALLSGIGGNEEFRYHARGDLYLRDTLCQFHVDQQQHFPGMGGVMRLYGMVLND